MCIGVCPPTANLSTQGYRVSAQGQVTQFLLVQGSGWLPVLLCLFLRLQARMGQGRVRAGISVSKPHSLWFHISAGRRGPCSQDTDECGQPYR